MNEHETQPQDVAPAPPSMARAPVAARAASHDERVLAAVAHGLTFFEGGLIGPLIIYLVKKDESELVAFHALQSLYFGALFFGIALLTCGVGGVLLALPYMIFEAIATYKAYEGEYYELPIAGAWARKRHPGNSSSEPVVF